MDAPVPITGLSAIAAHYDAVFCDAWGVIHNGQALFPGVADALGTFHETRGPVVILTNAPRLADAIPPQLDRLGLPRAAYDRVITSGEATRASAAAMADQRFFRLGPNKDDGLFSSLPQQFVAFEEADAILCTGLFDDLNETPEDYRQMLTAAAARKLPMICANPDRVVKFGDRLIYCAGALGDLYEALGGNVILSGKPHAPIYDLAMAAVAEKGVTDKSRILAIGDGLQTDILGANRQGIDVLFIADGIFAEDARGPDGRLDQDRLSDLLKQYDVHARYAAEGLKW